MDRQELLLHQLFQTVRIIVKGLNLTFEPYQLYSSEWSVITTLKQTGPLSQKALAIYLNIEPPAISRTLSILEQKGIIERTPGTDKREKTVSLSRQAVAQYPELLKISQKHRQAVLANLSDDQQASLQKLLEIVFANAQQFEIQTEQPRERR